MIFLFLPLTGFQGYPLCECLIAHMHANSWVLFLYFVLVLTLPKMKSFFSLLPLTLSSKQNVV